MYRNSVIPLNKDKYTKASTDTIEKVFSDDFNYVCSDGRQWVCRTCHDALTSRNMPLQAKANALHLNVIPPELSELNSLELRLISLRVPFMKMVALSSGKQRCIHGPAVNVPSKLDTICTLLPRLPSDTELIPLKLKRKLSYRGHYMYDYIRPDKVLAALAWLKANNPLYADAEVDGSWLSNSVANNAELFTSLTEETTSRDESPACSQLDSITRACDVLCDIAKRNGYSIHDVPSDGNCLFAAIAYQLPSIGINGIDMHTLRSMVVSYLESHPYINGIHCRNFLSAPVVSHDACNSDTEAPTAEDEYISAVDDPDTRAQLHWERYL